MPSKKKGSLSFGENPDKKQPSADVTATVEKEKTGGTPLKKEAKKANKKIKTQDISKKETADKSPRGKTGPAQRKKNPVVEILRPAFVLFIICAVVTAALAGANFLTKDIISGQGNSAQNEALARIIPADGYKEKSFEKDGEKTAYYIALEEGKPIGAVYTIHENGYGGKIEVMAGIMADGGVGTVEVTGAAGETPGLGQNIKNPDFLKQYSGKSGKIGEKDIDTLTGATISSNAVTRAINAALAIFDERGLE